MSAGGQGTPGMQETRGSPAVGGQSWQGVPSAEGDSGASTSLGCPHGWPGQVGHVLCATHLLSSDRGRGEGRHHVRWFLENGGMTFTTPAPWSVGSRMSVLLCEHHRHPCL